MNLELAEFRQIGRARDLGRAAAGLGRRRRASWGRASRRRACALTMSRRTRKVEFRRRARASRRRTSRRRSARRARWRAAGRRAPGRPVGKSNSRGATLRLARNDLYHHWSTRRRAARRRLRPGPRSKRGSSLSPRNDVMKCTRLTGLFQHWQKRSPGHASRRRTSRRSPTRCARRWPARRGTCVGTISRNEALAWTRRQFKFIFTPSPYRAAAGRGLCRPDLGEVVLACVKIDQCSQSPIQYDDSGKF